MRERANAIGARLLVDSHLGAGTWIQVEVTVNSGDTPG
jgi:signal transduction histidine kinase